MTFNWARIRRPLISHTRISTFQEASSSANLNQGIFGPDHQWCSSYHLFLHQTTSLIVQYRCILPDTSTTNVSSSSDRPCRANHVLTALSKLHAWKSMWPAVSSYLFIMFNRAWIYFISEAVNRAQFVAYASVATGRGQIPEPKLL